MSLLGLLNTEDFSAQRFTSIRRSVFYQYPNGAAPLLGLLSMLDGEVLNDPEFKWFEDRLEEKSSVTVVDGTTAGPWFDDNNGAFANAHTVTTVAAAARTAGTAYWLKVASNAKFRANDILKFKVCSTAYPAGSGVGAAGTVDAPKAGGVEMQVRVLPNSSGVFTNSTTHVRVTPIATRSDVTNAYGDYTDTKIGLGITVIGNANAQGQSGSNEGAYAVPKQVGNCAQIFRTPFSFTNTALKTAATFDESGPYKDKAKKASMSHMIDLENSFLWGDPSKSVDGTSGLPTYTTGGILFFMRLWEVGNGNAYSGVTSTYGNSAATANSDDNKRIININGALTESDLDDYIERLFRMTNNISSEKMCFCGSGFLNVMNKLYKSSTQFTTDVPMADAYGMNVVKHVSPFGTIYYKTHPLFNRNASLRYNALFFDAQNMRYRYMQDRDTDCKKNTENNNDDFRRDEWLTEAGLELQFPEACMYMVGVTSPGTAL